VNSQIRQHYGAARKKCSSDAQAEELLEVNLDAACMEEFFA
jgi:hypothetical protein